MTATNTPVRTEYADTGLEDMLMQLSAEALAVVSSWGHLQTSLQWSRKLSAWLVAACKAEADRRAMKTTRFPSLEIVNDWTNAEVAGGLALGIMLCDASTCPMSEQFAHKIRNAMVATATNRLLDAEPEEQDSCDD